MHHEAWLKDVLVFLVAAGLIVPLFHRARVGAVLGFLLIGVAVGPYGFGALAADYPWLRYLTIEDRARVEPFAELGVMFLLFLIGIEMSVERLWSLRRFVAGIGSLQFLLSAVAIRRGAVAAGRVRRARRSSSASASRCRRPRWSCSSWRSRAAPRRRSGRSRSPCCCSRT